MLNEQRPLLKSTDKKGTTPVRSMFHKALGLYAGAFCFVYFVLRMIPDWEKDSNILYSVAYLFWCIYFILLLSYDKQNHAKQVSFLGKFLACLALFVAKLLEMLHTPVDWTTTNMVASLLFLASSVIFTQDTDWNQSFGKIGSTILLACALASLKADAAENQTKNVFLCVAFLSLFLSVFNAKPVTFHR